MKMKCNIAISGMNYVTDVRIDPESLDKEVSRIQKGPYELYRVQRITAAVCLRALKDADMVITESNAEKAAIFFAASYGTEEFRINFYKELRKNTPALTSPSLFPFTTPNSISASLSVLLGAKGINLTFTGGLTASSAAVTAACDALFSGKADIALVVGEGFLCEDFSKELHDQGFKQECCAAIVLEREKDVVSRGRKIHALIKEYGHGISDTFDGYDNYGRALSVAGIMRIIMGETG